MTEPRSLSPVAASWDAEYSAGPGRPADRGRPVRDARFDLVIGIQVFQHGRRAQAARVRPGGLLCVRANAAGTDVEYDHDRFEEDGHGGYSVRYRAGPKTGLDIHFFSAAELTSLVPGSFTEVLPLREQRTPRHPLGHGHWSQWEVIWRRADRAAPGLR